MDQDKYLPELITEKESLDPSFVHALRLLAEEIEKFEGDELRKDGEVKKYLDIISNKNIKLSERVLIPVQQYPKMHTLCIRECGGVHGVSIWDDVGWGEKSEHTHYKKLDFTTAEKVWLTFNFVGKLLGPRGNSMKRLQEETGAKMSILGKGSMRDKGKEEELRKSGEAKYVHLSNDLHVLIEVFAPPGEAYSRMSHALEEIKKFLVPDYNDEIRQEQLRELSYLNGSDDPSRGRTVRGRGLRLASTATTRGRGGAAPPPPPGRAAAAPRGTVGTRSSVPTPSRGVSAPRARGTPGTPGYRPPPLKVTHKTYEDYGYDDGYDGEYDDESYEAYDDNYSNQSKSVSEYYEYGHGNNDDTYNNYAEEDWISSRPNLKAPAQRVTRGGYRDHPYGRY